MSFQAKIKIFNKTNQNYNEINIDCPDDYYFTFDHSIPSNIDMLLAIPPANNDEAMPTSIDHPSSSEEVEPRTGHQTQTLIDLLETIRTSDLTTIWSSEQSATVSANVIDYPVNHDVAMPSG